ncbi:MAG: orotate phosphoribosyltransferase [Candidatus Altiarchaeia archaeon]|jgi:orotate phosphoribosyltransferase
METQDHRRRLLELIKKEALFKGDYTLSSGKKSGYYIDLRLITMSSEGAYLIANILFDELKEENIDAIGGLTMGADPIAAAYAAISFMRGKPSSAFIIRKEEKKHGKGKLIEGPLKKGARVVIVDDVATSGGSLIKAIEAAEKEGCTVVKVMSLVDRNEGASSELAKRGYALQPLYNLKDLGV